MSSLRKQADKNGIVYGTDKKLDLTNKVVYDNKVYTSETEAMSQIKVERERNKK